MTFAGENEQWSIAIVLLHLSSSRLGNSSFTSRVLRNPTFPPRWAAGRASETKTLWCWQPVSQPTAPRLLFVTHKQHQPSAFSVPLRKQHVEAQNLPTAQQPTHDWVTAARSSFSLPSRRCLSSDFLTGVCLVPSAFLEASPKWPLQQRAQYSAWLERRISPKYLEMLPWLS